MKATMSRVLHDVSARALQIHGSLGASNEMPLSRYLIESFHMGLADGPTEVHSVTLARELLSGHQPAGDLFPTRLLPKLRAAALARYADVLEQLAVGPGE